MTTGTSYMRAILARVRPYAPALALYLFTLFPIWLDMDTRKGLAVSHASWSVWIAAGIFFAATMFPKRARAYSILVFALVYIPCGLRVAYYHAFGRLIDRGGWFALFDTNLGEAAAFMGGYANAANIASTAALLLIAAAALWKVRTIEGTPHLDGLRKALFLIFIAALGRGLFTDPRYRPAAFELRAAHCEYANFFNFADKNARKFEPFKDIRSEISGAQTYVFVIGESASRRHHSLYGYARETNPLLGEIRGQLHVFQEAASPATQTITSLQKVLTFADFESMEALTRKGSVVNFFKDAGFKTFWISGNMPRVSKGRFIAAIAEDADVAKFDGELDSAAFGDLRVVDEFKLALSDAAPKKAIFLHLMGQHWDYAHRYPPEFEKWRGAKSARLAKVDAYDNATLFVDHVLRRIIDGLAGGGAISALAYFSDHGEDADGEDSCFCHNSAIQSDNMFEVPLVIWLSPEYRRARPGFADRLAGYTARRFNLADFPHAAARLAGLSSPDIDPSKSPFDPSYREPKKSIVKQLF